MSKAVSFRDFTVRKGKWAVEWTYIGEGDSEDYEEDDPDDTPHLRATLIYDGECVQDGSYCTLATPKTSKSELRTASNRLLNDIGGKPSDFKRQVMEKWTWTEYSK